MSKILLDDPYSFHAKAKHLYLIFKAIGEMACNNCLLRNECSAHDNLCTEVQDNISEAIDIDTVEDMLNEEGKATGEAGYVRDADAEPGGEGGEDPGEICEVNKHWRFVPKNRHH